MSDPQSLALMALAIGGGAFVKGVVGAGLPVVALPVLAIFFGVPHAIAIMVVPVLLTNAWQMVEYRNARTECTFLPWLLAAAIPGSATGTWLLAELPERQLSVGLAAMVVCYIALRLVNPSFALSAPLARRLAAPVGFIAGALHGSTGISAPASITFLHAVKLSREAYIFVLSSLFVIFSMSQLPALTIAGILTWPVFLEGLMAIVPAVMMLPVGTYVGRRIKRELFDRIVLLLLAVLAVKLLIGG